MIKNIIKFFTPKPYNHYRLVSSRGKYEPIPIWSVQKSKNNIKWVNCRDVESSPFIHDILLNFHCKYPTQYGNLEYRGEILSNEIIEGLHKRELLMVDSYLRANNLK